MNEYGHLYEVISRDWFTEKPVRITMFLKLLNAADGKGVVEMSRGKYGKMFGVSAEAAFYFLQQLEKQGVVTRNLHANYTQVTISDIKSYKQTTRNLHAKNTQEKQTTRKLHANYTQVKSSNTDDCEETTRNLHAIYTQEAKKEERKESTLSPTPPITIEKIEDKKPLTRGYAPDFVSDVSTGEEPPKARAVGKRVKTKALVTKARECFEQYYKELYDDSYYWSAKDAVAMKRLLQKLTFGRQNKASPLPCDDESLINALYVFLRMVNKQWLMNNFSVTKIESQYNEIISEIKNNRRTQDGKQAIKGGTSASRLANQAANIVNDIAKADRLYYRGNQAGEGT